MRRILSLMIAVTVLVSLLALTPMAGGAATTTGWTKIANGGIDDPGTIFMIPSVEFKDRLFFWVPFVGVDHAAPVWSYDGTDFTHPAEPVGPGFGDENNWALNGGFVYQGYLYMGTLNVNGGQIWRTSNGTTWERFDENIPTGNINLSAKLLGEQDGKLIIEYDSYDSENPGARVWAYDGTIDPSLPGAFTEANEPGFGLNANIEPLSDKSRLCSSTSNGAQFNGRVQVCAYITDYMDNTIGFVPLEYRGGTTWVQTAQNNFGDENNEDMTIMATVGDAAYTGTTNYSGGQLWKMDDSGWNRVPIGGITQATAVYPAALGDQLEVCTSMTSTQGMPVSPARVYLQNPDGSLSLWIDQFDDPDNMVILASEYNGQYIAGAGNPNGFQIWSKPVTPVPTTTSLSPSSRTAGQPSFTLTVNGTNFVEGSIVRWNGADRNTTYVSATRLTAVIPASDIAEAGTASVTVFNPSPGGGTSNPQTFTLDPATNPAETPVWYLAEGTSDYGYDTYITMQNPNDSTVTALVTYMTKTGPQTRKAITLPAMSQTVINPRNDIGSTDFSTRVKCKEGKTIAVDRRMIWTGPGAPSQEGHSSVGVTAPAKTWYLPEGSSRWGFETWLLIQNPNNAAADCTVTYMIEGEGPVPVQKTVPANSRASFSMETDIGQKDASIKVESSLPVIPERATYRNNRREGHCSIGTTTPARDCFLAEGATGYGPDFTTWVLVQNPQATPTDISFTYMTGGGEVAGPTFQMPANSRKTIKVNDQLQPGTDVSTKVHGSAPVIAERAMYWDSGTGEACHDSIGMAAPHTTFYLPDGETGNGYETWTLVQNPNASSITVEITYMTPTGKGNKTLEESIPAHSRRTFSMVEHAGLSGRASIMVTSKTSGKKMIVERAMYWNNRGAGTDTIGGYGD